MAIRPTLKNEDRNWGLEVLGQGGSWNCTQRGQGRGSAQDLPTLGDADVPESQGLNLGHSGGIPGGNVLMLTLKNGGYYAGCDSQEGDF